MERLGLKEQHADLIHTTEEKTRNHISRAYLQALLVDEGPGDVNSAN